MAAVNFNGVLAELESILKNASGLSGARIYIEETPQFGMVDSQAVIAAYLDRIDATDAQNAAAGKRTRFRLRIPIWVAAFNMESYRKANEIRNTFLGELHLVLMGNRTLNNVVTATWLEGGDLVSASERTDGIFVAAGEVVLIAEVSAVIP